MKKVILLITLILLIGIILTQGLGCSANTDKEPLKGYHKGLKGLEQPHNKGLVEKQGLQGFEWEIKLPPKGF